MKFPAPVHTGPRAHSPSYTVDVGSLPGIKLPGHGINHPPLSMTKVKERVELYLSFPSAPSYTRRSKTVYMYNFKMQSKLLPLFLTQTSVFFQILYYKIAHNSTLPLSTSEAILAKSSDE
jgi:hypothetical protein